MKSSEPIASTKQKTRSPIVKRPKRPLGKVTILIERCKGCHFCIEFCPQKVLSLSPRFNAKGYHFPVVEHPELCVNCQLCYYLCPDMAIFVVPENNTKMNSKLKR